jgi:hypothetical protein
MEENRFIDQDGRQKLRNPGGTLMILIKWATYNFSMLVQPKVRQINMVNNTRKPLRFTHKLAPLKLAGYPQLFACSFWGPLR